MRKKVVVSFCTQCGARLSPNVAYCRTCGARVANPQGLPQVDQSGSAEQVQAVRVGAPSQPRPPDGFGAVPRLHRSFRIGRLSPAQTTTALRDAGITLAALLLGLLVLTGIAGGLLARSGHHGSPAEWFRAAVALLGTGIHAPLTLHVGHGSWAATDGLLDSAIISATGTPLVISIAIVCAAFCVARGSEARAGSGTARGLATAVVVTAGAFAVGSALVAAVAHGEVGFGTGQWLVGSGVAVDLGVEPWAMLPGAFLLVGAGGVAGRGQAFARARGTSLRAWIRQVAGDWGDDLQLARNLTIGAVAVTVLSVVGAGVYAAVVHPVIGGQPEALDGATGQGVDAPAVAGVIAVLVLAVPNLFTAMVGAALGASVHVSAEGSALEELGHVGGSAGFLAGGLPAVAYLVPITMLVMALLVGARSAMQRSPSARRNGRVWRPAAIFVGAWLVVGLALQTGVSLEAGSTSDLHAGGSGRLGAGLGLLSLVGAAAWWSVLSAACGPLVARFCAAWAPRLARHLGGRRTAAGWQLLLADALLSRGKRVPARLAPAEQALRAGAPLPVAPLEVSTRHRRTVLAGAVAVCLGVGGYVAHHVVERTVFTPSAVVAEYLADVSSKNVSGAMRLLSENTRSGVDRSLLTSRAMTGGLTDARIVRTRVDGDQAKVTVEERVAGQTTTTTFALIDEGRSALAFPRWRLVSPFTWLTLTVSGGSSAASVDVNGVSVPTAARLPVFPGSYDVSVPAEGLYEGDASTVVAAGSGDRVVELAPAPGPMLQTAAQDAVNAYLDDCATSHEAEPSGCPFGYWGSFATDVVWTISSYPVVGAEVIVDDYVVVSTDTVGTAHIDAVEDYGFGDVETVNDDQEIDIEGTLSWDGTDPSTAFFSPDAY